MRISVPPMVPSRSVTRSVRSKFPPAPPTNVVIDIHGTMASPVVPLVAPTSTDPAPVSLNAGELVKRIWF